MGRRLDPPKKVVGSGECGVSDKSFEPHVAARISAGKLKEKCVGGGYFYFAHLIY